MVPDRGIVGIGMGPGQGYHEIGMGTEQGYHGGRDGY